MTEKLPVLHIPLAEYQAMVDELTVLRLLAVPPVTFCAAWKQRVADIAPHARALRDDKR